MNFLTTIETNGGHLFDILVDGGVRAHLLGQPKGQSSEQKYGGTGIRARVKRITTAYANHYTIPPTRDAKFYKYLSWHVIFSVSFQFDI